MLKKYWIIILLIGITFVTGFLLAGRSASPSSEDNDSTCCSLKTTECPLQQKETAPGEMIMESLSRQFLVISPF